MEKATRAAAAQYTTNSEGERIVAASRRADGTLRKERRVREGYVPPEEQRSYVSRGGQVRLFLLRMALPSVVGATTMCFHSAAALCSDVQCGGYKQQLFTMP
jgi:hypothetical protein